MRKWFPRRRKAPLAIEQAAETLSYEVCLRGRYADGRVCAEVLDREALSAVGVADSLTAMGEIETLQVVLRRCADGQPVRDEEVRLVDDASSLSAYLHAAQLFSLVHHLPETWELCTKVQPDGAVRVWAQATRARCEDPIERRAREDAREADPEYIEYIDCDWNFCYERVPSHGAYQNGVSTHIVKDAEQVLDPDDETHDVAEAAATVAALVDERNAAARSTENLYGTQALSEAAERERIAERQARATELETLLRDTFGRSGTKLGA